MPFLVDSLSNDTISTNNYIIIPKRFALSKEWYNISGKIQKTGLLIDTLSFNNELSLTIGNKSQGLFKKPKPIVLVEYSNPYVKTQSMQNIIIKNEFWIGVVAGMIIASGIGYFMKKKK